MLSSRVEVWVAGSHWVWRVIVHGKVTKRGRCQTWAQAYHAAIRSLAELDPEGVAPREREERSRRLGPTRYSKERH